MARSLIIYFDSRSKIHENRQLENSTESSRWQRKRFAVWANYSKHLVIFCLSNESSVCVWETRSEITWQTIFIFMRIETTIQINVSNQNRSIFILFISVTIILFYDSHQCVHLTNGLKFRSDAERSKHSPNLVLSKSNLDFFLFRFVFACLAKVFPDFYFHK